MEFKPTWLYVKRHTVTGMLYFGKTTCSNPYRYSGSGKYWLRHINRHGKDMVETVKVKLFTDEAKCNRAALAFSVKYDIVNSKSWANLKEEDGIGSGGALSPRSRRKIGRANSGRYWYNDGERAYKLRKDDPKIRTLRLAKGALDSTRAKIGDVHRGRTRSAEANEKNRQAHLGKKFDLTENQHAYRSWLSLGSNNGMWGRTHTDEVKARLSALTRRQLKADNPMWYPEAREKISQRMLTNNPSKGKKFFTNGEKNYLFVPGDPEIKRLRLRQGLTKFKGA